MTTTDDRAGLRAHRQRLLAVAIATFAVDLATKAWASAALAGGPVHLVGPLRLRLGHNPGIAFGLGDAAPAWLILTLTGAVVIALATAAWRGHFHSALATGLILGGAVANLVDRLQAGTVIDMFDLSWWPTFNVADIGITIGAGLLVLTARPSPPAGR